VQLFFILSGCGLAVSYLRGNERFLVGEWVRRRFRKIVLPYWIIVAGTFILANVASLGMGNDAGAYSWLSLLAYLSFTRNHYEPSQGMNPSLWFIPVIICLYALFPILMRILKKYGISRLLILAGLIMYGSITLFEFSGYTITHQNAIFLFFLLDFAIGMVVGYVWFTKPDGFDRLLGTKSFFLGFGFYALSYAATQLWKYGDRYNDALTGAGLFLMTISLWSFVRRKTGGKLDSVASEVSRVSYMMYLIRVPLILYVLKPLLGRTTSLPLNPLLALVSSGFFIFVVFLLARFLYGPVMSLSLGQTWFTAEARRAQEGS